MGNVAFHLTWDARSAKYVFHKPIAHSVHRPDCLGPDAAGHGKRRLGRAVKQAVQFAVNVTCGTGGPLILVPILLWRGADARTANSLGQAAQLPVSVAATIANAGFGFIDATRAVVIGGSLLVGVLVGQRVARRLDTMRLGV